MADENTTPPQNPEPPKERKRQEGYPNLQVGGPGRNTKYRPEFVQKVEQYIEEIVTGKRGFERLPTLEGLALYLQVDDPDTVVSWANKKLKDENGVVTKKLARPEFSGAIRKLKAVQKMQLMNDGIYKGKDVNDRMVRFVLSANFGMAESTKTDVTTKGEKLPTPILAGGTNVQVDNGN